MLFSYEKMSYQGTRRRSLTGFSKWNKWIYLQKVMSYPPPNAWHSAEDKTIPRWQLLGTQGGRLESFQDWTRSQDMLPIRSCTIHQAKRGPWCSPNRGHLPPVSAGVSATTTVPCWSRTTSLRVSYRGEFLLNCAVNLNLLYTIQSLN